MSECESCRADKTVCQYCIYKNGKNSNLNKKKDNIIYFNNVKDDNKSKKICPICKKNYTEYPAVSRRDNKTLICSECGMKEVQEPLEEILNEYGIDIIEDF